MSTNSKLFGRPDAPSHLIASQTPRHRPGYLYEIGVRDFRAIAYLTNAAVNDMAHDERSGTLLNLARSPITTTPRASSKAINNCFVIIFYCSCSRQPMADFVRSRMAVGATAKSMPPLLLPLTPLGAAALTL